MGLGPLREAEVTSRPWGGKAAIQPLALVTVTVQQSWKLPPGTVTLLGLLPAGAGLVPVQTSACPALHQTGPPMGLWLLEAAGSPP